MRVDDVAGNIWQALQAIRHHHRSTERRKRSAFVTFRRDDW